MNNWKDNEAPFNGMKNIPVIENIHQKVLEAVKRENALDMSGWHTDEKIEEGAHCGTTHCRGGWVVTLAGKAGRDLEKQTNTLFTAMQIYHKSCPEIPVNCPRYFEDNETAMADIIRCAEEESKLVK